LESYKINTPNELPQFEKFEQRPDFIKARSTYSNGLILITEQTATEITLSANFNWIKESDGSLTPDYNSPNKDFVDIK